MNTPTLPLAASLVAIVLSAVCPIASAQPAASAPAATTQPRREVVIPQGFKLVTVNNRKVLCESADEAWVTTTLAKVNPTTKPATLPSTILQRLADQRDSIIRSLTTDLAMTDMVPIAKAYDTELTPAVRKLDEIRPPVFYIVTSTERLSAIMRNGWTDPRYYYNRAADSVTFNPAGALDTEKPMDDVVFPAVYNPKDPPEKRSESLTLVITGVEAQISASIELRARIVVAQNFAATINNVALEPLKLKEDQTWFGVGVASILGVKYTSMITGQSQQEMIQGQIFEHPQNPLKMSAIDLLHPTDLKTMREEAIPAYFDTVRRKSARAIQYMVEKAGEGSIPKAVAAVRDKKPLDGAAMVKVVQDATTVDLTPLLVH